MYVNTINKSSVFLLNAPKRSYLVLIRPSSNRISFPVHRPGGLKRAYWNFFFPVFKVFFFFFTSPPGGAGTPTHWQCAATLYYRGFPHSLADHHGAHMSMRQLPFYISPSHPAPSPLAVLPLHLPLCAPSQPIETIKTPCMGEGV